MVELAVGKYLRISEENYEEMLETLNIGYLLRKAALASIPQQDISEEDGVWSIKTSTILKTIELKFKFDETFDEVTPDGREVSSIATVEGNKIVVVQNAKKKKQHSTRSIREFTKDGFLLTIEVIGTGVTSIQKFKRV